MANAVDIRKVNSFLKQNGIDPNKFKQAITGQVPVLSRKKKKAIERLASEGKRVLVYLKDGKFVVRDADRKFSLEDPEFRKAASEKRWGKKQKAEVAA